MRSELSHDTGSVTTGVTVVVPVVVLLVIERTHNQSYSFPELSPSGHVSIITDEGRPHQLGIYLFVMVHVLLSPGKRTTVPLDEQSHEYIALYEPNIPSVTT